MKLSKISVLSSSISGSSANGDVTGSGEISDPIAEAAKGDLKLSADYKSAASQKTVRLFELNIN